MYRAAIAGLGNIAWKFDARKGAAQDLCLTHAEAFRRHPRVTICGGFATEERDRQSFGATYRVPVFETFDAMVQQRPDIVSICSPAEHHFNQLAVCLRAEVPMIWLEKPPVATDGEMAHLLHLAQGKQSKILVNFQRRYAASYRQLRESYLSQTYGACVAVQVNYSRGLEANGSHLLDLLFFILGEQQEWEIEWISRGKTDESPAFVLAASGLPPVMVTGASLSYHCIDITLIFEQGRLAVLHGGMTASKELRREHEFFPGFYRLSFDSLCELADQDGEMARQIWSCPMNKVGNR